MSNLVPYVIERSGQVDFHNLENIKIKQLEDGIKINNKTFKITKYYGANDYDALYENTINYIIKHYLYHLYYRSASGSTPHSTHISTYNIIIYTIFFINIHTLIPLVHY